MRTSDRSSGRTPRTGSVLLLALMVMMLVGSMTLAFLQIGVRFSSEQANRIDDERFKKQYFSTVPGKYFSGDGAHRDSDGYYQVIGRIDDVLNVSGHRIGTAEIESSLVAHEAVAEAAVVGRPDELTGQALVAFVSLKPDRAKDDAMASALRAHVAKDIGKFAAPKEIRFADALPKTRSGKIMRRLLKDVAAGRDVQGDVSTLEDASVIQMLQKAR
jgi:acetyl-CoA synthetase